MSGTFFFPIRDSIMVSLVTDIWNGGVELFVEVKMRVGV